MLRVGVLVALTAAGAALAGPGPPPDVITSDAPTLHPEGVSFDPHRGAFVVGSVRHGTVSVVSPDGTVAVDAAGNAYVTDIAAGEIYRVDPAGRASLLLARPDLLGDNGVGPNGIVWHPGGYLLVVRYDLGTVLRVPVHAPEQVQAVRLDHPVTGGDGLVLRPNGELAVVINNLASTATPTTATVTRYGTYVLDGRLPDLFGGSPTDGFTIRRL